MKKKTQEKESMQGPQETTGNNENTEIAETGSDNTQDYAQDNAEEEDIESAADKVVAEVRAVEDKLAEMQDKYIRLSAEFDNYRKRTLREKMDLSKYAEESILQKLVPFMDDFDRALLAIAKTENNEALKNGIDLIYVKFSEFLKQNGVKEMEALNTDFNVDLHEAVAKVPVEDPDKKGKVVDVVLKGYYLRDKVLRFAKVVVGE